MAEKSFLKTKKRARNTIIQKMKGLTVAPVPTSSLARVVLNYLLVIFLVINLIAGLPTIKNDFFAIFVPNFEHVKITEKFPSDALHKGQWHTQIRPPSGLCSNEYLCLGVFSYF